MYGIDPIGCDRCHSSHDPAATATSALTHTCYVAAPPPERRFRRHFREVRVPRRAARLEAEVLLPVPVRRGKARHPERRKGGKRLLQANAQRRRGKALAA
eukprot:gene7949-biopygen8418